MQIDSYTCTIQQVSQYTHQNCGVIYIYKQAYQRYLHNMPPFGCTHQSFIAGFEVSTVQMQGADTCGQRPLEIDSQRAVTLPAVGAKRP